MPYLGNTAGNRFVASKAATQFSGDGSTTAFTLDHAVGSDEDILVSVDGVIQEPSVAYAVSNGTTLTFTGAPSNNSGNNIFVYYLFRTVGTVDHPSTSALSATSGTFSGAVTAASLAADGGITVDNITIDATEIDLSSGSFTIDSAANITLDCGTGEFLFNNGDNGNLLKIQGDSSNVNLITMVQDKDLVFKGNDGGSTITALTLDMSSAGLAIFSGGVNLLSSAISFSGSISTPQTAAAIFRPADNTLAFSTANTERGRFDSAGNLTVGAAGTSISGPDPGVVLKPAGIINLGRDNSNSGVSFIEFRRDGTQIGSVTQSGTTGVAFNTSSDYRLKENIVTEWDATTRLKQLKPSRFNFKDDKDITVDGFIAHEVSSIVPEAISGKKDETQDIGTIKDSEGNVIQENVIESEKGENQTWEKTGTQNVYQQIDQSKLVPLLTKALQEQQATIESLTARITALEKA